MPARPRIELSRRTGVAAAEVVTATAAATAVLAALQDLAQPAGLGVFYLLAVLVVAVRRGQVAALITAVLCMLTLNYLFISPRHQLTIAHRQDVVELAVLLITAAVVGRLAAQGRAQAAEAERRAELARRAEQEATLLARTASAILAGGGLERALARLDAGAEASGVRVALEQVPQPREAEIALALRTEGRRGWLYARPDAGWDREELSRVIEPLSRVIEVALERERAAGQLAEVEGARRADAARTAILHAVSHDLRSPLTAITAASAGLRSPGLETADRAELMEVIDSEAGRLAKLVDDLLDISRIEAGAVDPRADWCDLRDVISSALAGLGGEHPVELAVPGELPLVRADAAQLERVFSNLIDNAIRHSPPGRPVRVAATVHGGRIVARVIDRGPGIPAAQRARVLEPFFRGRASGAGSGLGLAICRGFVEANGGQIAVGEDRGGGAAITVSFPVAPQPQPEPVA